ncbi:hypothetical protein DFH09DRAFT_1339292 [Mycena vulgaris]|nr:hypothetical protein DFH09DRAFT_1339292 [Mycena vulgaris]
MGWGIPDALFDGVHIPPVTRADGGGLNAVLPTPEKVRKGPALQVLDDTAPIRALVPADAAGYICLADHKMQLVKLSLEQQRPLEKYGVVTFLFDRLGCRMPTWLISAFTPAGFIENPGTNPATGKPERVQDARLCGFHTAGKQFAIV